MGGSPSEDVATLCSLWDLRLDGPVMHGGLGLAVPVARGQTEYVIKTSWPDGSTAHEALALRAWNGQGAVSILEWEPALSGMLLERLNPNHSLADVDLEEAVSTIGSGAQVWA